MVARISLTCDVPFHNSDDPHWKCNFLKMSDLQSMSMRALELSGLVPNENVDNLPINQKQFQLNRYLLELKKLSQHMHDNAFDGVWFGVNSAGILGACPTDLMHAFLHGLIPYVTNIIISYFTTTEKHDLDIMVDNILVTIRSGERSKYPQTNFAKGISNLKLLTANEWAGVAFALSLLVSSDKGFRLFQKVCKRKRKQKATFMDNCANENDSLEEDDSMESQSRNEMLDDNESDDELENTEAEEENADHIIDANDVLYVFEMMLSFHAWYKCGGLYKMCKCNW